MPDKLNSELVLRLVIYVECFVRVIFFRVKSFKICVDILRSLTKTIVCRVFKNFHKEMKVKLYFLTFFLVSMRVYEQRIVAH